MPRKIGFTVVNATSQDNLHKTSELVNHSPSSKGWKSGNFCLYPQELILELNSRSHVKKIQLLSHQHLIATKVEFFIGDSLNNLSESALDVKFSRLGYVSMSNNEKTQFKARELKSVHVDAIGKYIKLVIHKNYINKYNHYNQVGIIAINIIGDDVSYHLDDIGITDSDIKSNIISPTEDLAFDMRVDPETAQVIRKLEKQKMYAVKDEQFDKAQKIKEKINYLTELGEVIGKLEVEKKHAVEKQNYDRAQLKKHQIEQYRYNAYRELDLIEMMDVNTTSRKEPINLYSENIEPIYDQKRIPTARDDIEHFEPKPKFIPNSEDRPLPALVNKGNEDSLNQSYIDKGINDQKNNNSLLTENEPSDESEKVVPGMTKNDMLEANDAIEVYGLPLVSKIFSKNWSNREDALLEVKKRLEELPSNIDIDDIKSELKAVSCILKKSFKSRNTQVIQVAIELNKLVLVDLAERFNISKPEIHSYLDNIVLEIFKCTEDMKPQIKDLSYSHLLEMSQWETVKKFTHIYQISIKPFENNVLAREGVIRSQLLLELYSIHGLINNYYTLDNFMKFATTALQHKSADVRESAEVLIVVLYRNEDKGIVRSYLPPDDAKTRKNLLYKRLFEKLDKIDGINGQNPNPIQPKEEPSHVKKQEEPVKKTKEKPKVTSPVPVTAAPAMNTPKGHLTDDLAPYDETVCIFCGEKNEDFVTNIDMHYWKYCPILRRCPHCKQAVEISLLTQHLLQECEMSSEFSECSRCREAIIKTEYDQHVSDALCTPADLENSIRCPLCHENIPLGKHRDAPESLWQYHLMDEKNGCSQNPRRLVAFQRQNQTKDKPAPGNKNNGNKYQSQLPKPKAK